MPGTLLVVEDDDAIRGLLVEYFKTHADVEVDAARDGAEALHRIATRDYAVVLLDLMMPHMSGVDFLSSLEALTSDPSIKLLENPPTVFVITSMSDDAVPSDEIQHRFPALVRGVMRKPLDVGALAKRVEACL
ncbi:MAG TPA: response regulator [Thermoanaerobaculia bacterium]|nr:response regulator [Thermoanaerobaculia bacterium]